MKIPKILHLIWIGKDPFPYEEQFKTWVDKNKGWDVFLWTDKNIPKLHNQKLYDKIPYNAGKADVLRIELLANYGGVYTDADSVCLKPIEPLIKDYESFGMTGNAGDVAVGFMGCTENNKAFNKLKMGFTKYVKEEMKKLMATGEAPKIHLLGTWYVTPRLRSFPSFTQIERGKKLGTRRYVVTTPKEVCKETYVQQLDHNTWNKKTRDRSFHYIVL
jgi:hypothetical protein